MCVLEAFASIDISRDVKYSLPTEAPKSPPIDIKRSGYNPVFGIADSSVKHSAAMVNKIIRVDIIIRSMEIMVLILCLKLDRLGRWEAFITDIVEEGL